MNAGARPSIHSTFRRLVWPDIKPSLDQKVRLILEGLVVLPFIGIFYKSMGLGMASIVEGIIATIAGAVVLVVLHILLSILKVPWQLYCEQQQAIEDLSAAVSKVQQFPQDRQEIAPPIADHTAGVAPICPADAADEMDAERVRHTRSALQRLADDAPTEIKSWEPVRVRAWIKSVRATLDETLKVNAWRKFRWSGEPPRGQIIEAQAMLRAIATKICPQDLKR